MINGYTGDATFQLDGKPLTLCYTLRAISEIRSVFDETVFSKIHTIDPADLAKIVHFGLKKHHPDITQDQILDGEFCLIPTIQAVQKAIEIAYWGPNGIPQDAIEPQDTDAKKKIG